MGYLAGFGGRIAGASLAGAAAAASLQYVGEITTGVAASSLTIAGLNGNDDEEYRIAYRINHLGANTISMQPNGISAAQVGARASNGSSFSTTASLVIAQPTGTGDESEGTIDFFAAKTRGGIAQPRTYRSTYSFFDSSAGTMIVRSCAGRWSDVAANILTIDIAVALGGAELGAGSYFAVWKKKRL